MPAFSIFSPVLSSIRAPMLSSIVAALAVAACHSPAPVPAAPSPVSVVTAAPASAPAAMPAPVAVQPAPVVPTPAVPSAASTAAATVKVVSVLPATPGVYHCELNGRVTIKAADASQGLVKLNWRGKDYDLHGGRTATGALRFENASAGLAWIHVVEKAFLLDTKKGNRLANECRP